VEDDELWRSILRGLNKDFYHQTVSSQQVEKYFSEKTGKDLTAFFDQYLRTKDLPELNMFVNEKSIIYKYKNTVPGFDMPVKAYINEKTVWLYPESDTWVEMVFDESLQYVEIDNNFLVKLNFDPEY
jgi:aminopeptidase N